LQRCEAIWSNYEKLIDGLRKVAPAVEQLKGISSGLRGATEIAGNFKVMIKTEYEKEEISKELAALKISLVDDIQKALKDGADKQREDFIKAAGKSEGLYTAAVMSLDQIKNYLYTLRNQNEFIEKNPSLFDLEAKPPPPSRAEVAELVEKADKAKKDAALNQEVARIHKARQTTTSAPQPPANEPQPTQRLVRATANLKRPNKKRKQARLKQPASVRQRRPPKPGLNPTR
jgi:prophage DNA circulation protein